MNSKLLYIYIIALFSYIQICYSQQRAAVAFADPNGNGNYIKFLFEIKYLI